MPYASVYASSKAAISCLTEALAHQLIAAGTELRAAVFYPSGGLLDTGLWTAQRNRPDALQRDATAAAGARHDLRGVQGAARGGGPPGRASWTCASSAASASQGVKRGDFIIGYGLDEAASMLHRRADAIGAGQLPPAALS